MPLKKMHLTSTALIRGFIVFILLLLLALWLFGSHVINTYLVEKKHNLNAISSAIQMRIDSYRLVAYQLYETANVNNGLDKPIILAQEVRLRPDVYYVDKPHKKTEAMIFGSHESSTFVQSIKMSEYLDILWASRRNNYALYYLNGTDNSLTLISTQPLQESNPRFKDSNINSLVESRRAEMLQQANILDERESFSPLRKYRFLNDYYFTQRIIFNQPGHLATIIAFDLPINDIIPLNMARANFSLVSTDEALESTGDSEEDAKAQLATSHISGAMLEIAAPFGNAPLKIAYRVPLTSLILDLLRNNLWLVMINLVLIGLSVIGIYLVRQNFLRPNQNMAVELKSTQTLSHEVIANLPLGLLIYNFSENRLVASNKIADHLLPHLSLQKIANLAESHQGIIQATVNNEVYEIRMFKSQLSPNTWLFQLLDQDKEVLVNKKLQQAQRELNKNHQARRSILKNLQQELTEPLLAINALVDTLIAGDRQPGLLVQLKEESTRLTALVDNLRLLTRLEMQDWQPANKSFNLQALVEGVLAERLPLMAQKGLNLFHHYRLPFDQPYLGDAIAVRKVLTLLLDYSIINTDYGKIILRLEQDPVAADTLMLTLSDTGTGIKAAELANLQQPFVAPAQADRYQRGSAIAWFLCNQLCKQMGGRLEIVNNSDIGSHYTARLILPGDVGAQSSEGEMLLEGTLVLLDIANEEVRVIINDMLHQWGAECLYVDEHHLAQEHDVLLTDQINSMEDYAILLDGEESGLLTLTPQRLRVNYNLSAPLFDAIVQMVELRITETQDSRDAENHVASDADFYQNQLQASDYYSLFVETVPDDVKRLYTEAESGDLAALAQTAHRLKGVFAMLNLVPGKQGCETLEQHIKEHDNSEIGIDIRQIDVFVTKMLQHAR